MRLKGKKFFYSASDLSGYIHCRHLTTLNKKAVLGEIQKPEQESRLNETLQLRGQEFEKDQLTKLKRQRKTIAVVDRRQAIKIACQLAMPNDIILIAGKGHENYQEVLFLVFVLLLFLVLFC